MAPQKMTLAAMLLSLLVGIASGASLNGDETTDGFISKCLGQTSFEENSCQDRRRPALGHFYTCRLLGALESPPTRISKKGGDTFVAVEGNTLRMSDSGEGWNEANLAVIPEREAIDRYNNRYYADGGTTYVTGERDSKATEIVTSGSYAFNEMALDDVNDLLFILPIDVRSRGTPSGSLYAVQTNRLIKDTAGKIRALKLDQFQDHFTALHIPKNSTSILLGVSELETGKLLELNFNKYDPCTPGMEKRDHFSKTIAEASESLVKIFDEAMKTNTVGPSRQRTALADNGELQRLRAELRASETKLERYTRQISTFTGGLKKVQTQSQNMDKVTGVSHIIGGSSCKQDVESLQSRVDLLEGILSGTIALLDGMNANATAELVTDAPELLLRSGLTVDVTTEAESQETDEEYRARLAKYFGEPTMI